MPSKKQKRKTHKKTVETGHRKKYEKLKARTRGTEDNRARLEGDAASAHKFIRERQESLVKLLDAGTSFNKQLELLQVQSERLVRTAEQAQTEFNGEIPDVDAVERVIQERDEVQKQNSQLRTQINDRAIELSELRLKALEDKEPQPPKWLVRIEREFEKTARIPERVFMMKVATRVLDWARDDRLLKKGPKSTSKKSPIE